MNRQRTPTCPILGATIGLSLLLSAITGCGKLTSGANSVATVKYRPAAQVAAEASAANETAVNAEASENEGGVGTLRGRVVYVGNHIPLSPWFAKGAAAKDPSVCGLEEIPNESILVKDGGLANTFVYLDKIPKGVAFPIPTEAVLFDQKVCIFSPHAIIVRVKQTMKILNADGAAHNTHTYPKKNTAFNSVVQPNDRTGVDLSYTQSEKEPLSVGCDIHPWMTAYHLPLDHPFAAVSAADGSFEIKDLPAGKHEFKVWHEAGKMVEKAFQVTIKPGDNAVTINVPASKLGQ